MWLFLGGVSAFIINGTTGKLTPVSGSPFATSTDVSSLVLNPSGEFLYASNGVSDNVTAFVIDGYTGALTFVSGSPFAAGTQAGFAAVDPAGKFLYVANVGTTNLSAFTIDSSSGALTAVAGSSFRERHKPRARLPWILRAGSSTRRIILQTAFSGIRD